MIESMTASEPAFHHFWQIYIGGLKSPGSFANRALNTSGILKAFLIAAICTFIYTVFGMLGSQPGDLLFGDPDVLIYSLDFNYLFNSGFYHIQSLFIFSILILFTFLCGIILFSVIYYLLFRRAGKPVQLEQVYKIIFYPHAFLILGVIPYIGNILGAIATVLLIHREISSLGLQSPNKGVDFFLCFGYLMVLYMPIFIYSLARGIVL
jgi:hypothetical protein